MVEVVLRALPVVELLSVVVAVEVAVLPPRVVGLRIVVFSASFGVAQHLMGFVDRHELLLRRMLGLLIAAHFICQARDVKRDVVRERCAETVSRQGPNGVPTKSQNESESQK